MLALPVIAKLEKPQAVENLEEIVDAFDGVMVARGDLGVQVPLWDVPLVQKRAVELAFPHAIFITFNGSEFRCLFPDRMPIFYMYSLKRGVSAKPWFLPDEIQ